MTRVEQGDLEYAEDGLYYLDEVPFTGVLVYKSKDGRTEAESEYRDGMLSGRTREWHPSGKLARESQNALGVRHGSYREWDDQGQLVAEDAYEYGIRVSGKRWDPTGELVEEFLIRETDPGYRVLLASRAAHGRSVEGS